MDVFAKGFRKYDKSNLHSFESVLEAGDKSGDKVQKELQTRLDKVNGQSTCVLIYTSGTTGKSKGVVQTHGAVIGTSMSANEHDGVTNDDFLLSYLPMAWVGDYMISVGQGMAAGACINCPEGADTFQVDLREVGPTFFLGPPALWERIKTSVNIRIEDAASIKRKAFNYFMKHADRVGRDIWKESR